MSLTTQFEQDADALKIQDSDLVGVAAMAKRAKELEKELEDLEETVKERKAQFRKLTEESIPEVPGADESEVIQNGRRLFN
jgi:vacuolar-type H+-ATPase subunit I/STV1